MALSYGSQGDEVKKLQKKLNEQGYNLVVDGIYGSQTQSAVKDYQKKNNLSVDGIVGSQTRGSLGYGTPKTTDTAVATKQNNTAAKQPARPTYTESQAVKDSSEAVKKWEVDKPGEYKGSYQEQIDTLLNQILNGEKFSYDVNADALYNQYKDKYIKQGQQAMQDTMGQAAALTGGYGSSYATTAGSQAYQSYLEQLNDIVPQLQEAAYKRYLQEKSGEREALSLLKNFDEMEYARHRDSVSDYWQEGEYLWDKLSDMSDDEWNKFLESSSQFNIDRDYEYKLSEFDYRKAMDALSQENQQQKRKASSEGGSVSSSKGEKTKKEMLELFAKGVYKYPQTYSEFAALTGYSGILTNEEFSKRKWYQEVYGGYKGYLVEMFKKYYMK